MKEKVSLLALALGMGLGASADSDTIAVRTFKYAGPYAVVTPYEVDSLDVNSKRFDVASLLEMPLATDAARNGAVFADSVLPSTQGKALHLLRFTIDNEDFAKATLKVDGVKHCKMIVDGKTSDDGKLVLTPATHEVVLKCLTDTAGADTLRVSLISEQVGRLAVNRDHRRYTTRDIFTGTFMRAPQVSPSGRYLYSGTYFISDGGESSGSDYALTEIATGRVLPAPKEGMRWMPSTDRMYYTRKRHGRRQLVAYDPATTREEVLATDVPEGGFTISPTEDFLIYTKMTEGPKEKSESLYEILNPEDRQPNWRNRGQLVKYDFATGVSQPLTFGHKNVWLCGISDDGSKALVQYSTMNLGKRPSQLSSLCLIDLATMQAETLVDGDGFLAGASLSPDGTRVAMTGSPEAFGGIGKNLDEGLVASMYDYQLYLLDVASKRITALTRDFDPSVQTFAWSRADGCIYFTAEAADCKPLYRVKPTGGKVESLGAKEDCVMGFSLADKAPVAAYYGESADNSYRMYTLNTRTLRSTLQADLHEQRAGGISLGKTEAWSYVTSRGDTIQARYNLPPDFDGSKSYPMIVYYYGGCSPTSRYFDSTYNPHLFAAHGYVSLVINPSGASGFGQNFSARHVATAGEGVAQDIIEGVKRFADEHGFVDAKRIGCCGASYGGFMTQYLQTQTDLFAAAVSHAGISDHTSYWGEGYWGYSYSEVSMAHKYPWADRDLFVGHSPLYNADKINTPLLFLHGDADTNVPFSESIRMFTALKLLGKETALVAVKGENHHILTFDKREQWLNTLFAWFDKYLKGQPQWWQEMYPDKTL